VSYRIGPEMMPPRVDQTATLTAASPSRAAP
jgi:hypothetical protein